MEDTHERFTYRRFAGAASLAARSPSSGALSVGMVAASFSCGIGAQEGPVVRALSEKAKSCFPAESSTSRSRTNGFT
jgi:hypothetical protein